MVTLLFALATAGAFPYQDLRGPAACAMPEWPREALRYELEGRTALRFQIGADGSVQNAEVSAGSGWRLLDQAALRGLARCRFKPDLAAARAGDWFALQYAWTLEGPAPLRPVLAPGSCRPSPHFLRFDSLVQQRDGRAGVRLRFLVDADGRAQRIVAEPGQFGRRIAADAVTWLRTCRFAISPAASGERTDTSFGWAVLR